MPYKIKYGYELDSRELKHINISEKFDSISSGIVDEGGVTIVGGYTGMGKSLALLHMAVLASQSVPVLYFSCENLETEDGRRWNSVIDQYCLRSDKETLNNFRCLNISDVDLGEGECYASILSSAIDELGARILFIDGSETLTDDVDVDSGVQSNIIGKKFAIEVERLGREKHIPVVMGWQLGNQCVGKPFEELGPSDFMKSLGVCQKAIQCYVIGRNAANKRCLRIVKSRVNYNYKNPQICLEDDAGRFNLRDDLPF